MMTDDLLVALDSAHSALPSSQAAWIVGVGILIGVPPTSPVAPRDMLTLGDLARDIADFPVGPIAYADEAPEVTVYEDFHTATYRHLRDGEPHLSVQVGLGTGGYVGIGGTRHGHLDLGVEAPGHVLLSDVEAKILDLYGLLIARAAQLGHRGEAELALTVTDDIPGRPLTLRRLDPTTGELSPETRPGPVGVLRARFDTDAGVAALYASTYALATEAAHRFGAPAPELLYALDITPVGDYEERYANRFATAARLRGLPADAVGRARP